MNFLDPFGLDEVLYDEIHNAIAEIKKHVSTIGVLTGLVESIFIGNEVLKFRDGSSLKFGKNKAGLGAVLSIADFIANTALTWFDVGVYVNQWLCAAWEGDADKMIEINKKIAKSAVVYAFDAVIFSIDLYVTKGYLSQLLFVVSSLKS